MIGVVENPHERCDDQQRRPFVSDHGVEPLGDKDAVSSAPSGADNLRIGAEEVSCADRPDDHQQDERPDNAPDPQSPYPQQFERDAEEDDRYEFTEDAEPAADDALCENSSDASSPVQGVLPHIDEEVAPRRDVLVYVPVDEVREGRNGQIARQEEQDQAEPDIPVGVVILTLRIDPRRGTFGRFRRFVVGGGSGGRLRFGSIRRGRRARS